MNLSQQTLSVMSGVSYSVLKKFERTGQISLESLLKLAVPLGAIGEFAMLFPADKVETVTSLDELMSQKIRRRGRK